MPRGESANYPAYCACGKYGSPDAPLRLIQVNAHRTGSRDPACEAPPWLREGGTGEWRRALASKRRKVQTIPVRPRPADPPPAAEAETPPVPPPPPPAPFPEYATVDPAAAPPAPPPAPSIGTGRASIPTAKELMVQWGPPRPPMIAPTTAPQFPPKMYDMFDWDVQQGWDEGDMGAWLFQCVYLLHFHLIGWVPGMVPVALEMRRPSLVTGQVVNLWGRSAPA